MTNLRWIADSSITTRMRSVLERLQAENAQIYAAHRFESFYNWVAPLALLDAAEDGCLTAAEMARTLKVSAPTMSQTLRDMTAAGLVAAASDPSDGRRKRISLDAKGQEALLALRPLLGAYAAVSHALDRESGGLLRAVNALADAFDRRSLAARVADEMASPDARSP